MNIIKTVNQVGNRRLSSSRGTDKCHLLTTLGIQLDIIQNLLIFIIAKINIIKYDISNKRYILHSPILTRMPPCPPSCRYITLYQFTVNILYICQCYQTIIQFQLFIHQRKDAGSTCGCHNNRIQLLGNLRNRHRKRPVQLQKGCQTADTIDCHKATQQCCQYIRYISQVPHNRHQDIRKLIRLISTVKQLLIHPVKAILCFLLMRKHLNNLLTAHHLLDIAVHNTEVSLLALEINSTLTGNFRHRRFHNNHHDHDNSCQVKAQHTHRKKDTHHSNRRR